ncbi:MAG TPA: hypothetical protein DDX91_01460 [Ruminococcaceae bacterium]|nr:hypothetical protein [Oscillospiraceae bacterium]
MTSKERAKLKSIASVTETIFQIGKNPLSDSFVKQVKDALAARELIKIRVLDTCEMLPSEFARTISEEADCQVVQVIGSRVVLFKKRSRDDKKPSLLDGEKQEKTGTEPLSSKSIKYGGKNGGFKSETDRCNGRQGYNGGRGYRTKRIAAKKQGKR